MQQAAEREPMRPEPMRPIIFIAVLVMMVMLTGCATGHFYTWQCPDGTCSSLEADDRACQVETSRTYSPKVAGPGPLVTIYKDCMEKKNYVKVADGLPITVEPG